MKTAENEIRKMTKKPKNEISKTVSESEDLAFPTGVEPVFKP